MYLIKDKNNRNETVEHEFQERMENLVNSSVMKYKNYECAINYLANSSLKNKLIYVFTHRDEIKYMVGLNGEIIKSKMMNHFNIHSNQIYFVSSLLKRIDFSKGMPVTLVEKDSIGKDKEIKEFFRRIVRIVE